MHALQAPLLLFAKPCVATHASFGARQPADAAHFSDARPAQ